MLGRHHGNRHALLLALLLIAAPLTTAAANDDGTTGTREAPAWVEPVLLDRAWLEERDYLRDGNVSLIVQIGDGGHLTASKDLVLSALREGGYGFEERLDLQIISSFSLTVPHESLDLISSVPEVKKIWLNWKVRGDRQKSVPLINADDVWEEDANESIGSMNNLPIEGEGVRVAILDSGIRADNKEFGCFHPIKYTTCDKVETGWDYVNNDNDPKDDSINAHGTHIAGIIGANGASLPGVAPNTTFLIYKVLDENIEGNIDNIIASIQESTQQRVDVISMSISWYCGIDCDKGIDIMSQAVENATEENIIFVTSQGNKGPDYSYIGSPQSSEYSIAVGATYKKTYHDLNSTGHACNKKEQKVLVDQIACFSSRGPTGDGRTKPDLVAPGSRINSTKGLYYGRLSGTSMSAPHVSGVVSLMKQAYPSLKPDEIKVKLRNSTIIYTGSQSPDENGRSPDNTYGWGRVDALRALDFGPTVTSLAPSHAPNQWHTQPLPLTINLTSRDSTDLLGFTTGPRELYWRLNDQPLQANVTLNGLAPDQALTGTSSHTLDQDGAYTFTAWGIDNGGNREPNQTLTFRLDATPPVTEATLHPTGNTTTVALAAHDATSGLDQTRYRIDNGPWHAYTDPVQVPQGSVLAFHSTDVAGNSEPVQVVGVPAPVFTEPDEGNLTVRYRGQEAEHALPPALAAAFDEAAVTAGPVRFEVAIEAPVTNLTEATLTVTNQETGATAQPDLVYNRTLPDGRHVYASEWLPPRAWALEDLSAEAVVVNADGAQATGAAGLVGVPVDDKVDAGLFCAHLEGDAACDGVAVSATGSASCTGLVCAAASGTGDAACSGIWCAAASGAGDAACTGLFCPVASPAGNATCTGLWCTAASATGNATCGDFCIAATGTGNTNGGAVAASLTGNATCSRPCWASASATGNATCESRPSALAGCLAVSGGDLHPSRPHAPQNPAAETGPGHDDITLTWDPSLEGTPAWAYRIHRADPGQNETAVATVRTTSYIDEDLAEDTTYRYRVTALNIYGESPPSEATYGRTYNATWGSVAGQVQNAAEMCRAAFEDRQSQRCFAALLGLAP